MFICTMMSIMMETTIAKAKAAFSLSVKTAVCVRNPGPIAEVAIRKAAPISTLATDSFFSAIFVTSYEILIKPFTYIHAKKLLYFLLNRKIFIRCRMRSFRGSWQSKCQVCAFRTMQDAHIGSCVLN